MTKQPRSAFRTTLAICAGAASGESISSVVSAPTIEAIRLSLSTDHEAGRHRQRPRVIPVRLGQVDAELQIDLPEVIGQWVHDPELAGDAIPLIVQHVEANLLRGLAVARRRIDLGRDHHERRPGRRDVRPCLL